MIENKDGKTDEIFIDPEDLIKCLFAYIVFLALVGVCIAFSNVLSVGAFSNALSSEKVTVFIIILACLLGSYVIDGTKLFIKRSLAVLLMTIVLIYQGIIWLCGMTVQYTLDVLMFFHGLSFVKVAWDSIRNSGNFYETLALVSGICVIFGTLIERYKKRKTKRSREHAT